MHSQADLDDFPHGAAASQHSTRVANAQDGQHHNACSKFYQPDEVQLQRKALNK